MILHHAKLEVAVLRGMRRALVSLDHEPTTKLMGVRMLEMLANGARKGLGGDLGQARALRSIRERGIDMRVLD